ncbi:CDP-alcohol phosphatidyltransferase family protein [Planosporangium thailandense]|uniref:CDP-alcohol phosphatidyltransferase family protein n=1 Tax=Planosporangium thailandense TaxID=765197 RepID=A0ABX0XUR0_9ACTN|nr:CDP-alcohol phosphatidyltransferase family protein [Planosporangium thailandense]
MTWEQYAAGWRELHGGYDPHTGSAFVRGWLRLAYLLGRAAARVGATPGVVTGIGLALSVGVPVAARLPLLAALLVVLSAVADTIDGAVAVLTGRASRAGQVYDSLADRVGEACWLVALGVLGVPAWLLLGCGGCAWLHEYVRARATAAGMNEIGVVTVAERPTRIILAVAALVAAGTVGGAAATAVTAVWTALTVVGFAQLMLTVRARLR